MILDLGGNMEFTEKSRPICMPSTSAGLTAFEGEVTGLGDNVERQRNRNARLHTRKASITDVEACREQVKAWSSAESDVCKMMGSYANSKSEAKLFPVLFSSADNTYFAGRHGRSFGNRWRIRQGVCSRHGHCYTQRRLSQGFSSPFSIQLLHSRARQQSTILCVFTAASAGMDTIISWTSGIFDGETMFNSVRDTIFAVNLLI